MKKSENLGALFVFLAGALWGTMGIFVRSLAALGLTSMQIVWLRVFTAAIFIGCAILFSDKKKIKINIRDLWIFIGTGIFSVASFTYFYFISIQLISMSAAAVFLYTAPVFVMIMSAVLFKEKITLVKVIACVAAFCGCLFTSGLIGSGKSLVPMGIITGILSGVGYALYSIFGKYAVSRNYNSLTVTFYTFLICTLGITFFCDVPKIITTFAQKPSGIAYALVMGILSAALPYILYTMGLARIESGKAAVIASVEPVVATVMGLVVYNETIDIFGILGIILIISVVVLLSLAEKKKV